MQHGKKTKTLNFSFSRRRAAADLRQTLHEDRICPYHVASPLIFLKSDQQFRRSGTPKSLGGNVPSRFFAYKFLIYQPIRIKF